MNAGRSPRILVAVSDEKQRRALGDALRAGGLQTTEMAADTPLPDVAEFDRFDVFVADPAWCRRMTEDQLQATRYDLEQFSGFVSHDMHTPLRAIASYCRTLRGELAPALNEEQRLMLNLVLENSRRLLALIDDLRLYTRIGSVPFERQLTDMNRLVADAWAAQLKQSAGGAIHFTAGDLPPAMADPGLIRPVWDQLLSNALKFSSKRAQPRIEVGSRVDGAEISYWVRDNGAGFDMKHAHKLFVAFERLHGLSEFPGTGVGLAIVRRAVSRHGGRVWVEAQKDCGATIHFSLPATPDGA